MKKRSLASKFAASGCALALVIPTVARAEVSDADFNALKDAVKSLADQVQKLQSAHTADQQTHQKDVEEIQQLKQKLNETQKATQDIAKSAELNAAAPSGSSSMIPTDGATVNHNFSILGDAEFQYAKSSGSHSGFVFADFAPIFLYRGGDNVLFEAGFDFILQNNSAQQLQLFPGPGGSITNGTLNSVRSGGNTTTINLSFAQLDYVMNDYMTLAAGNILLPLGVYSQRGAGWLNKFPDDPMSRDLLPGSAVGAQILGAIPVGTSGQILNYAVFGVNGPSSADGTGSAAALDLGGNVGLRTDNSVANLHGHPGGGARIGYFVPLAPHYDFEIGLSGESSEWDDAGSHLWTAGVLDAAIHVGPFIEARGEYMRTHYGSDDMGNVHTQGWWVQAGYKLAGLNLDLPVLSNTELVGRFDTINDGLGNHSHRYSVGYIYYISNTLLFEGDYEFIHTDPGQGTDGFILQLSYGF